MRSERLENLVCWPAGWHTDILQVITSYFVSEQNQERLLGIFRQPENVIFLSCYVGYSRLLILPRLGLKTGMFYRHGVRYMIRPFILPRNL